MDKLSGNSDHIIEEMKFQEERYFYMPFRTTCSQRITGSCLFFFFSPKQQFPSLKYKHIMFSLK